MNDSYFIFYVIFVIISTIILMIRFAVVAERSRKADLKLCEIEKREALLEKNKETIRNWYSAMEENCQQYPWLAALYADLNYIHEAQIENELRTKRRPAIKAADELSKMSKEKRKLQKLCKMQEYQLNYYETLFPWLEEFKQLDPMEGWEYTNSTDKEPKSEYDSLRNWLSPEEYKNLPNVEKYQLALDRYQKRPKSDWLAGIEYERYVGYKYETQGYRVMYQGALKGKEDMGIDVIAEKGDEVWIVQCKRWNKEKILHEKHVFQLYGSTIVYRIEHKEKKVYGSLVTTACLSELACTCCKQLGINYLENYTMEDYPVIKCNVTKQKEKIYHLPFDQQYDKIKIDYSEGDCYAKTVAEAENLGFRRALRWHGNGIAVQ